MECPKCGGENPDGARFCCSCGSCLAQADASRQSISIKVSTMAIASFTGALCSLTLIIPMFLAVAAPGSILARWEGSGIAVLLGAVASGVTAILGFVSACRIERSGGRITGRVFAVGAVLIGISAVILVLVAPMFAPVRSTAYRMVCGTNLSGIGKAMLIYSNDYDDEFPRAGGRNSTWAQGIPDWKATNRFQAYGISPSGEGGVGTISSCFYLLVRYAEVTPKSFLCKSEPRAKTFEPAEYGAGDRDLIDLWDFGPEPWKHCSYSYHMPSGLYALTTASDPGMAVAADRNPWIDSPFVGCRKDFSKFNPDGKQKAVRAGNTLGHQGDGQNVFFLDGHVGFERNSFAGVNDDNIYTFWDGEDIRRGAHPVRGSQPQDRLDSLLVHDPPVKKSK